MESDGGAGSSGHERSKKVPHPPNWSPARAPSCRLKVERRIGKTQRIRRVSNAKAGTFTEANRCPSEWMRLPNIVRWREAGGKPRMVDDSCHHYWGTHLLHLLERPIFRAFADMGEGLRRYSLRETSSAIQSG